MTRVEVTNESTDSMGEAEGHSQDGMEDPPEERRGFVDPRQKARRYQLEVLDKALEGNIIIFLETGCGKTLIAVLLIEALSHLIRKPSKKIAVFLVPNRALVEQQAKEIEEHTDLRIGRFWGSMGEGYSWSYSWWQEQIVKYEVIVMTPQILFNNMHHCFLKMEMIELLVFDECHHAQKRHPYANIMRDFYHGKRHSLPKIFGLTASPIIGKVGGVGVPGKIDNQINKLESMLDARVYTLKDRMELESLLPNPNQHIRKYKPSYESDLFKDLSGSLRELRNKYANASDTGADQFESTTTTLDMRMDKKEMDEVSRVYHKLDYCIHDLGLWCTIKAADILLNKEGQCLGAETFGKGAKEAFLRDALAVLKAADFTDASFPYGAQGENRIDIHEALLSPKLWCLVDVIKEYRENYTKCIIFVDRVVATTALSSILNHLKCLSFIRCLPLVGSQSMSQKSQQQAIEKFRSDEVNMLVATDIAEEGLDIQSCFMVIRFNGAPKTTRSFIQSRGRARQKGSNYIVLLESGNQVQLDDVVQLKEKEKLMWESTENRGDMPGELEEPEMFEVEFFEVESTGARVTTDYSVPLLYRYCLKLPGDEFYQPTPEFFYFEEFGGIVCEIRMPITAPLQVIRGHPCQTEKMARRVAALEACKQLHQVGALTDHLLPAAELEEAYVGPIESPNKRNLPADPMAQMELHSTHMPEAFRGQWAAASANVLLFAFALHIVAEPRDREYADFALFIEEDLDDATKASVTELYLTKGRTVRIQLLPQGQVEFDVNQLRDAKRFQERIFSITLDPKTEQDSQRFGLPVLPSWDPDCLYLTLPLLPSARSSPVAVDWKSVQNLLTEIAPGRPPFVQAERDIAPQGKGSIPFSLDKCPSTEMFQGKPETFDSGGQSGQSKACGYFQLSNGQVPVGEVVNSLVETVYNGRLYCVENVFWEMDAHAPFGYNPSQYGTYVDYFKKRYKLDILHPKQLLLKAKPLMKMHNLLVKRPEKESGSASKTEMFVELPPELCCLKVLGFPTQLVNTVSLIPSFMHRIEYFLLATQLQKKLEGAYIEAAKVSPHTVLQALTTARCLESFSLERLELFGDSFLKFAVSKRLFLVHNNKHEGALTKMRQNVICNSSLHRRGVAHELTRYIHDELFSPLQWSAPGRPSRVKCDATNCTTIHALQFAADASNPNQVKCSEGHRWLQKKAVADVVEGFIGAHLVDGGPEAALAFMQWVGIDVYFDNSLIAEASARSAGDIRFIQGKDLGQLEAILGYSFRNKAILVEALAHPSYQVPFGNCYQRLEFLGDAVLDYLITSHLYATFPDIPPGHLTDLRSATASNECFARVAVRHHLHKFLLHENANLAEQVKKFVLFVQNVSRGREHFYGWECDKGPKVLGDVVESIAGAVLVDTGFDTDTVWRIFEPLLQPIVTPDTLHLHPVRELVELCNMRKYDYECISTTNNTWRLVRYTVNTGKETIVAQAEKSDKKSAKRLAAYEMLEKLKNLGWQHPYRALTTTLMSQGRLDPFPKPTESGNRVHMGDELEMSKKMPSQPSTDQVSKENHKAPSSPVVPSHPAGMGLFRGAEKGINGSATLGNNRRVEMLSDEFKIPSCSFINSEDSQDKFMITPQMPVDTGVEEKKKLLSSPFLVPSETRAHVPPSTMMQTEPPARTGQNLNLDSLRGSGQHDSEAMHRLSSSFAGLGLSEARTEARSVDSGVSLEVSKDVQILIDALVQHPVLQHRNAGASAAPVKTDFDEEVYKREARGWDHGHAPVNPETTMPSSNGKENTSGWNAKGKSFDENVGRAREDLHNLCAKYKWNMPNYEPCPDYPQGPPHSPRFAYIVKVSCSLRSEGKTCEYDIECEGQPMKGTRRAMDSAASCAMQWLQDSFNSGMTFAQTTYFY